ncbi:MAG TPA: type VI secretion system-associated FHA domain protein [Polyangia bacterium]|nr:type VI secretion system-associated FHA domain protein [Polyangia bacterium]
MQLEITISDPGSTTKRTLLFSASPVRIGRNQLNEIALEDPFVSEWHGLIRFGDESISYSDLGSTNGSALDGVRLAKNVPAPLTENSRILLGRIEITVSRPVKEAGRTKAWMRPELGPRNPGATPPPRAAARPEKREPARADAQRKAPVATGEAERGEKPPVDQGAAPAAAQRPQKILEAFCESFVGLRKGYEQFGAEVGVRTINGRTPLHRARSGREVLDYLVRPGSDLAAVTRDLTAIFADFGIHQIAMMEAVTAGARAVLQALDPRANDLDPGGGRLFSGAKSKGQWREYLDRFDQALTDDQELHALLFGPEFARAYARVTVGDAPHGDDNDDDD